MKSDKMETQDSGRNPEEKSKLSQLWNSLTETQKHEVLLAYEESEDDDNLISRDNEKTRLYRRP